MTPRRILLVGWVVFLLYAYPGYMLAQSADELVDSRYGAFSDVHSAMMTFVWRYVGYLFSGPAGMLFVQSLMLLVGGYRMLTRVMNERAAAGFAVALLLFPPLIASTAVITHEAQLASFLVAAAACLLSDRFWVRCIGLGLACIATGIRDGAGLATIVLVAALFTWRTAQPKWRRIAIGIAAGIAVVLLSFALERVLVPEPTKRAEMTLAMSDIIGTLNYAPSTSDAELQPVFASLRLTSRDGLHAHARQVYGKELFYNRGELRFFDNLEASDADALADARIAVVRKLPGAYLTHRWHYFYRAMGLARGKSWQPVYVSHFGRAEDVRTTFHLARSSVVQRALMHVVGALDGTFLFRPYFYVLLAIPLFGLAIARRHRLPMTFLGAGLAYTLGQFFVEVRAEYRDSHPALVFITLGAFALFALQTRNKRVGDETAISVADDDGLQRGRQSA